MRLYYFSSIIMSFSLVTINTWKCDGDYFKRIPLISAGLNTVAPHVVACQEVFHSENDISTKKYFDEELGLHSYFFPSRKKERKIDGKNVLSFSGLCFFTNLEVITYKEFFLPTHELDGERTAQLIIVNHNDIKIAIVNTHLTHLKQETDLRLQQLIAILNTIHPNDFDALFLCGDFNDVVSSKTIQLLCQKPYCFENTFINNEATHINGRCIDYIFYQSKYAIDVLEHKIILNQSKENILPSDHFGLYASYKINKNA